MRYQILLPFGPLTGRMSGRKTFVHLWCDVSRPNEWVVLSAYCGSSQIQFISLFLSLSLSRSVNGEKNWMERRERDKIIHQAKRKDDTHTQAELFVSPVCLQEVISINKWCTNKSPNDDCHCPVCLSVCPLRPVDEGHSTGFIGHEAARQLWCRHWLCICSFDFSPADSVFLSILIYSLSLSLSLSLSSFSPLSSSQLTDQRINWLCHPLYVSFTRLISASDMYSWTVERNSMCTGQCNWMVHP